MDDESANYDPLALRENLALDRTEMANERTLLSYIRTGLMLLVTGATGYKFMLDEGVWVLVVSSVLGVLGASVVGVGVWRFLRTRRRICEQRRVP